MTNRKPQKRKRPSKACFIEERQGYTGILYYVCSLDLGSNVVTVHDIRRLKNEADEQLVLVKAGAHPTQTNPAGAFYVYMEDKNGTTKK